MRWDEMWGEVRWDNAGITGTGIIKDLSTSLSIRFSLYNTFRCLLWLICKSFKILGFHFWWKKKPKGNSFHYYDALSVAPAASFHPALLGPLLPMSKGTEASFSLSWLHDLHPHTEILWDLMGRAWGCWWVVYLQPGDPGWTISATVEGRLRLVAAPQDCGVSVEATAAGLSPPGWCQLGQLQLFGGLIHLGGEHASA